MTFPKSNGWLILEGAKTPTHRESYIGNLHVLINAHLLLLHDAMHCVRTSYIVNNLPCAGTGTVQLVHLVSFSVK